MEREDSSSYIQIHYENINRDSRLNFDKASDKGIHYRDHGTPYDYKSIMHYDPMVS